ncbi:leucine-rich repeat domain-containing protein [Brachyspira pilosicoli]|uniref:leucine-rich repeat domain-containing protein n=1 Tax=Brachyspira pilosicoli TaxID=52584 RepID=UPI003006E4C5
MFKKLLFLFMIFILIISCRRAVTRPNLDSLGTPPEDPDAPIIDETPTPEPEPEPNPNPEPQPEEEFIIVATDSEEEIGNKIQKYYEKYSKYAAFVKGSEEEIKQNNAIEKINTVINKNAYAEGILLDLSETTITEIPNSSFKGNEYLNSVKLPDTLTSIGDNAFEDAKKLAMINFPSSLTKIGLGAFANCLNLQEANLKDTKITILYEQAFYNCSSLNKIVLPDGLLTIKSSAFTYCILLEEITFPEKFKVIERFVFGGCNKLKNVNFNNEIQSIDHIAFYGCTSLSSISLPSSLTQLGIMGADIFTDCISLSDVEYLGTSPDVIKCVGNVFGISTNPKNLYLPNVDEPADPRMKEQWEQFLGYNWTDKIKYKTPMPNN